MTRRHAAAAGMVVCLAAARLAGQDCNGNGTPDPEDIAAAASPDCNFNGVPDECEIDPAACPYPPGTYFCPGGEACAPDCNCNGVPDACDLSPPPVLGRPQTHAAGITPIAVAVGDLNGDGAADLAVARQQTNRLILYHNDGSGQFTFAAETAVGNAPFAVAAAPLNGDNLLDLATPNRGGNSVSVLLNQGGGVFERVDYGVGAEPRGLAAAQLVAGPAFDLAAANSASGTISILRNNGQGAFVSILALPVLGLGPRAVAALDLNGDGWNDLAVANFDSANISILLNNGNDTFAGAVTYPVQNRPRAIAGLHVDDDALLDLAVVNEASDSVSVLINQGNGTFAAARHYSVGQGPIDVAAIDIEADGDTDLVVTSFAEHRLSVLRNRGDGLLEQAIPFDGGTTPYAIAAHRLDADHLEDLAVTQWDAAGVSVRLNETGPVTDTDCNHNGRPDGCDFLDDCNHNCVEDILDVHPADPDGNGAVSPDCNLNAVPDECDFSSDCDGNCVDDADELEGCPAAPADPGCRDCNANGRLDRCDLAEGAADCNGDAIPDVCQLAANDCNKNDVPDDCDMDIDQDGVAELDCNANDILDTCETGHDQDCNFNAVADLCELAGADCNANHIPDACDLVPQTFALGNGPAYGTLGNQPVAAAAADLDGDGDLDLAVVYQVSDTLRVLENQGDGTFAPATALTVPARPQAVVAADFDGDGRVDLAAACTGRPELGQPGGVRVFFNDVGAAWVFTAMDPPAGTGPQALAAGRLDGDPQPDLAVINPGSNDLTILHAGPGRAFAPAATLALPAGAQPAAVMIADLNGVDPADIAVAFEGRHRVAVLLNGGTGVDFTLHEYETTVTAQPGCSAVAAIDLDGLNGTDLLVSNRNLGSVSVLFNHGDGTFLSGSEAVVYAVGAGPRLLAVMDLDADGDTDAVSGNWIDDTITVLRQNAHGTFTRVLDSPVGLNPGLNLAAGDLDGDGLTDLAIAQTGPGLGSVAVRLNASSPPLSRDCNANLDPDECDIAARLSEDCPLGPGNGVPDECELDCNANNVADTCDIAAGDSADCNTNWIPDECEPGGTADCQNNGIVDLCEISAGDSLDCDEDGLPDECEAKSGDCNNNGVPDACDTGTGSSPDCQNDGAGNGVPDECEIPKSSGGLCLAQCAPDCNANAVPDGCEIQANPSVDCNGDEILDVCQDHVVAHASPTLSPLDEDHPQSFTVPEAYEAGGTVTLAFEAVGDLGTSTGNPPEQVQVEINGVAAGVVFTEAGECPATPDHAVLQVPREVYNAALALTPGSLPVIRMVPSSTVDAGECAGSYIQVSITFQARVVGDCNGNGLPDECDVSTSDCDGNGVPDDCDVNPRSLDPDPQTAPDCNANQLPDACDVNAADPDGNGLVSPDTDRDGIPDECQCDPRPVVLLHALGLPGETRPFSGYIDPRLESSDGVTAGLGLTAVQLEFNKPVYDLGSTADGTTPGVLTPAGFVVQQTGPLPPPAVSAVTSADQRVVQLTLSRPLSLREWTTIIARVEDACGQPIATAGHLGPGNQEPDRIDLAFLPGDVDQSGSVTPIDLLRWRQASLGHWDPPAGLLTDYIDTDRSGAVTPLDLLRYRQLLLGSPPATQAWSGATLSAPRP